MAEPTIEFAEKISPLTLNGVVKKGDLLAHNGTGWVQADANDAATNLYAQYIAMMGGMSGDVIKGCKGCVMSDADAPYTANGTIYTSGTAGAHTHTRPATDGDVIQVIGRAISTTEARFDIADPKEVEQLIIPFYHTALGAGAEYNGAIDTGWAGPQVDAAAETFHFTGRFPSGMVGNPLAAKIIFNSINASAFDNDVTVVRAYDGGANNADVGAPITAGDWSQADTYNIILTQDISSCFDADFSKAGANFAVLGDPDGITADATVIGLLMRYLVV